MRRTHPRWKAAMQGITAVILSTLFALFIVTASLAFES